MEDWNDVSNQVNSTNLPYTLSSSSIEKKYLQSALTARMLAVGFKDPKNIKSVISYIRGLEKNYSGMQSPFYFEKFSKFNGKYFWSPYLPLFYSRAFEKFILTELNPQVTDHNSQENQGLAVFDFTTCSDIEILDQLIRDFGQYHFQLAEDVYKIYIRWPKWADPKYLLSQFLEKIPASTEKWMVFDEDIDPKMFKFLQDRFVKGILLNLPEITAENATEQNKKIARTGRAAMEHTLMLGINTSISSTQDQEMDLRLKSGKDLGVQFMVWSYKSLINHQMDPGSTDAMNKAAIERFFLKSNTNKEYRQCPILFYPEFFNRISLKGKFTPKNFLHYSFREGIATASSVLYRELFRFLQIPIEASHTVLRLAK